MSEQNLFEKLMADFQTFPLEDVRQLLDDELSKAPEEMDTKLVELCVEALEDAEKGQKLAAALKSDSLRMTSNDVHQLLAEELAKNPEEMDTDLVDLCVEALNDEHPEKPDGGEAKGNKNVFLLVALIAALLAAFLPSIASKISKKAENDIVALSDNGDLVVGVGKSDTEAQDDSKEKSPLLCALREAGVKDPVLPSCLLDSRLKFTVQTAADEDAYSIINIEFTDPVRSKSGFVKIKSFNSSLSENEMFCVNNYFANVHQTRIDELDAFSFSGDSSISACYASGNTLYTIFLADTM